MTLTKATNALHRQLVPVREPTPESLAPYGAILGPDAQAADRNSGFYGGAVTTAKPVQFNSDGDTCLSLATLQPRPFEITHLERHFKHTQTFIPLGGKPFIAVFGAPTKGDLPDFERLEAFRFDGNNGFCMHVGTWHEFPFALEPDTRIVVVLRNETNRDLANIADGEAHGPDLDKKNILKRTGRIFVLDV